MATAQREGWGDFGRRAGGMRSGAVRTKWSIVSLGALLAQLGCEDPAADEVLGSGGGAVQSHPIAGRGADIVKDGSAT